MAKANLSAVALAKADAWRLDKERSAEVKGGRQQFRGGRARRSDIVVVVVVVPVDVDTVVVIGVQREPRDRAALFAQALTDPPPFERLYAFLTVEFYLERLWCRSLSFTTLVSSDTNQQDPHQGRSAKPTRREKAEIELIFDFQSGEKPDVYPPRYREDFSPP